MEDGGYGAALAWLFARTRSGRERSVARMQQLMAELDLKAPPHVVHVVGTNGKGTVSAMIAAGLQADGIRTGLFMSPHVVDYAERISVDGVQIGQAEVAGFVQRMQGAGHAEAAFFELTLALGLEHFARERVEYLVLEAGVGARSDASMAVGNTVLSVITSIALDHTATLGDSITLIAGDKSAAIRPGIPVVTAETGEALEVVDEAAQAKGSTVLHPRSHRELFMVPAGLSASGTRLVNQKLAAAALRSLPLTGEAPVLAGIGRPPLPGRGQVFQVQGRQVLVDGAHDPAAAAALVSGLPAGYTLLYAGLGRKQRQATCAVLAAGAGIVFVTEVGGEAALEWAGATVIPDNVAAFRAALQATVPGGLLLVAGSLYLAGSLLGSVLELAQA